MPISGGGGAGGLTWVSTGDPTDWDFDQTDFTMDENWYDLDLSSIVTDSDAVMIKLRVYISDAAATKASLWRKNGNTGGYNVAVVQMFQVGIGFDDDCDVECDENQVIEYRMTAGIDAVRICVRGWWKPA